MKISRPARWAIRLIDRYQERGGGEQIFKVDCNFTPTCSEYTRLCLERFGFWRGCYLGWQRIRRCTDRDQVHRVIDLPPVKPKDLEKHDV